MKMLLILPPWFSTFGSLSRAAKRFLLFPPLNLSYLAAIAEERGHEVRIIDCEAEELTIPGLLKEAEKYDPDLIGITSTTATFHIAKQIAEELKQKKDWKIICGGAHVTFFKEQVFHPCFDYAVVGQCDNTFGQFLDRLEKNESFAGVPGILYRENGEAVFTGNNNELANLDELPFPARHLLRSDAYVIGSLKGKKKYTSIMFSRGCPFQCVFCSTEVYGKRVRTRSLDNLISELKHLTNDLGIHHFYFEDDTLTLKRDYILALCDAVKRENLKFTWEGHTRANLVDEELLTRMAESGLIRLSFGLETTDPDILKILKKGVTPEDVVKANRIANRLGIEITNSVMIGLPGDTEESINKTVSDIRKNRDIHCSTLGIAIPYPGSEMYNMALREEHGLKLLTQDFSKYQRYGSAVMQVNDLTPTKLLRLQRIGLLKIYSSPWRFWPLFKRYGLRSAIAPLFQALAEMAKSLFVRRTASRADHAASEGCG